MADLSTLQSRLTEAESAYHALMTGTREVEVQHDGMRVRYSEAKQLKSYIEDLKAQIAAAGGTVSGLRRRGIEVEL